MVHSASVWIEGSTRSGKTSRLIQHFCDWAAQQPAPISATPAAPALIFAAIGDNRIELADRVTDASQGRYPFDSATPLGFIQDEVILYYPLLTQRLGLKAQFPLRLRPETEQELATQLWRTDLDAGRLRQEGVQEYYLVRRMLDLLQLAAVSEVPPEDLPTLLKEGLPGQEATLDLWDAMGEALLQWRAWCLGRGLLTYGITTELYWRYLLPDPAYRQHLSQRYAAVLADDVDEYPAIARSLFTFLLDQGIPGIFTYNPHGSVRWGLGADPADLHLLSERCRIETLSPPSHSLGSLWGDTLVGWVREPVLLPELPDAISAIQTVSRAQLLRQTAEVVATAIHSGQVQPGEVAIIGPGLDAIARYTLREILTSRGIPVEALNDQQPLASSPTVQALLTLMALVYPGLGRLLSQDAIAEMLVVLSQPAANGDRGWEGEGDRSSLSTLEPEAGIDPVRAGLIVDHCFVPDPDHPRLLPATEFPRWDRLGFRATQAYEALRLWVEVQQQQQQQRLIPNPVTLLDRAIQRFLYGGSHLPYDRLAALRELMETAQHYWDVDTRLRRADLDRSTTPASTTLENFINLLRGGTITADPYPVRPIAARPAVTLATIFQYRANRCTHRWQFWLDAGSPLWLSGGGALFGAPLLLHEWSGRPWTAADALEADQRRLERQIRDLLYRAQERVYLCHSDLATGGQEQTGPLLTFVNAATPVGMEYTLEV